MKNILIGHGGAPTSVINASLAGAIKEIKRRDFKGKIYASKFGSAGILKEELIDLTEITDEEIELLIRTPGSAIGTSRFPLYEKEYEQIVDNLIKHDIGYVLFTGGNGSMDTIGNIYKYAKKRNYDITCVGIPKTIDNDLLNMDHAPGYGSCVKFITRTLMELSLDINAYKKGRVTIIETMGRDTGWLAASSSLANEFNLGPDLIYVPEVPFSKEKFYEDIKRIYKEKGRVIVVVAEALKDKDGNYVASDNNLDSFGHVQLGAISKLLADQVKKDLGINTRNVELSLVQRCASHIASSIDVKEAIEVGKHAVKFALEEKDGVVTIQRISSSPYKVEYVLGDLMKVANGIKYLPRNYINEEGNGVSKEFLDYARPFIDEDEIKITLGNKFIQKK